MAHSMRWQPSSFVIAILLHSFFAHAQSGDGGAVDGFSNSNLGAAGTGAEGESNSSANLSRGAIIAIAVVVALVVFGGITLAILFYLAKKRQWQVRKTIRRTASKAVKAMTPRTPAKMSFGPLSPRPDKQTHGFADKNKRDVEKGFTAMESKIEQDTPRSQRGSPDRLLKGKPSKDMHLQLPKHTTTNAPTSSFEHDSPKSPMWHKVFGRM